MNMTDSALTREAAADRISHVKAVAYLRVSTATQNPENQMAQIKRYCEALNVQIVKTYIDYDSGGRNDRREFQRMLDDSDRGMFDLLIIWSLDRFTREGISNTLGYLERLKRNGIAVRSVQESWLNTSDEGVGQLMLAIFAWLAKQERERIAERVRAGLDRAKRQGKRLGRPPGSQDKKKRAVSGYHMRYAGVTKDQRKLGQRKQK